MRWVWTILPVLGACWLVFIFGEGAWPPLPADFSVYWAGGQKVLAGDASFVYDGLRFDNYLGHLHETEPRGGLRFPYPPSMFLLIWPLGFLPFPIAWVMFLIPGMVGFFYIARRLTDNVTAIGMTFAIGGPIHSIQLGQNGFYTAALLVGGLLALNRSKPLAGFMIALLAIKPHLAVVAFLALLYWREWRALAWAIGTSFGMVLLSSLLFGPSIWIDFLVGNSTFAGEVAASKETLIQPMQQTFFALLIGSYGMIWALLFHVAIALAALFVCIQIKDRQLAIAAVAAATVIVTPYAYLYDSTMLVLACALLIQHDRQLSLLLALCIATTALWFLTLMNVVPFVAIAILLLAWLKDRAAGEPERALRSAVV